MTRFRLPFALVLLAATLAGAADDIRVPSGPVVPQPMPAPGGVVKLTPDVLYVIDTDVPVRVLASPPGLVKVTYEVAPLKIRGQFVDGTPGKSETRTYRGKHLVFMVEAIGTGRVELLIVPTGDAPPNDSDVVRRVIDVDSAVSPDDGKKDETKPAPKQPVAWVVVVEESGERTADAAKVLGDLAYWQGLKAKGIDWRFYDKDSADAKRRNLDAFAAEVGMPAVLFLAADGKKVNGFKLPKAVGDIDAKLKEHGK